MTASTPAIETRGLSKSFGRTEALAPLDLVVPRGAVFALVGQYSASYARRCNGAWRICGRAYG